MGEVRPKELLLAGDPAQKAEVTVVRVPLAVSERDPQALGGLALIDFFGTPERETPRVTQEQAVGVLSESIAKKPATFNFSMVGTPSSSFKNGTKYLRYDFESARCEGAQVQGVNGKVCQRSDTGEILPVSSRRHAIYTTVVAEPTDGAQVADGVLVGPAGAECLWVVDASVPLGNWSQVSEQVDAIFDSFLVDIVPAKA